VSKPLVSVIMTAYNCEKYIVESIESIFIQTFRDFELIIYHDGSTDKTWQKALATVTKRGKVFMGCVKLFPSHENVGCGEGRNRAIKKARGKYIAIQDADDISFRNRLAKEVEFMEKNDDIFCVGAFADKMEEDGEFIEFMTYPSKTHEEIYDEIMVKKDNPIIDPSCMYRKKDFDALGGYDGNWKLVPDSNLWVRAAMAGLKFANLQEVLVHYRQHPNSITNKSRRAVDREHFEMCRELFNENKGF
jgi:glycosyltransferase involved in cell wall biosynthesis